VAYADASRVGALLPAELPPIARDAGVHGVMLDTAVKDGVTTLAALGEPGVEAFFLAARSLGLMTAVAGALGPAELARIRLLDVGIVGVRGSACEGGRSGRVSASRVRGLRLALGLSVPASPAFSHP
jgi:(5-formylfuran-3-yl)methyl phosphate synthase